MLHLSVFGSSRPLKGCGNVYIDQKVEFINCKNKLHYLHQAHTYIYKFYKDRKFNTMYNHIVNLMSLNEYQKSRGCSI